MGQNKREKENERENRQPRKRRTNRQTGQQPLVHVGSANMNYGARERERDF